MSTNTNHHISGRAAGSVAVLARGHEEHVDLHAGKSYYLRSKLVSRRHESIPALPKSITTKQTSKKGAARTKGLPTASKLRQLVLDGQLTLAKISAPYKPATGTVTRKHAVKAGLEFIRLLNGMTEDDGDDKAVEVVVATNVQRDDVMDKASVFLKEALELSDFHFRLMIDDGALKITAVSASSQHGIGVSKLCGAVEAWLASNNLALLLAAPIDQLQVFAGGAKKLAPDVAVRPWNLAPGELPNSQGRANARVVIEFEVCGHI